MADGFNRFNTGGQYYYQNQHAGHPRNLHHRNGSPNSNSRARFQPNADTPSPNRSPGTHSPAGNPYSMYNHNSHRQNHGLLNGGAGHQNYQTQMNLAKHFQTQNHHQTHHLSNQPQDHSGGHGANYGNHQHNISAGTLSNNTPHFTPAHLQNGTPNNGGGHGKPHHENYTEQLREYEKLKMGADKPHYYARTTPHVSRIPTSATSTLSQRSDGEEHIERRRAADEPEEENVWQAIDFGGQGLKCMAESLFRYSFLKKIYFNHNKLAWLSPQIGMMRTLTVLDLSFNELDQLPPEIGMLTNLKRLLLFDNKLDELPFELGSLYQLEMLGLEGNPMRHDPVLMEKLQDYGTQELIRYLREQADTPPAPLERTWTAFDDIDSPETDKFNVLSWNILCDRAATQAAYGYASSQALSWDHRKGVIMDEIQGRNADIVCLQEVDIENYNEYFRPNLAADDYKGIFSPKARAQTMQEREAKVVDGCATFYKNSKYILLDKQVVNFSREAISRPDMKGEHDVYNRVMPRDHIAVVCFFENRRTGSRMIVANLHLAWEPWFADVKIIQVAILMEQLAKLAETYARWSPCKDKEVYKYAQEDSVDDANGVLPPPAPSMKYDDATQLPMLVCGDFNSTRDSGVYDLITSGSLPTSHSELGTQKYGDFTRNGMSHPFSLKSSYAPISELPFTNYTPDFREVIDYIWYSTNALQVTGLLGEIDPDYMRRVPGFPNLHFPSDHLALVAEFAVKGRKERKQVEADFGRQGRRGSKQ